MTAVASPPDWAEQVRRACAQQGLQLTPARAGVVSIIGEHEAPLGAYAILEALARRERRSIAPPTVYRALDFLIEHGFLHRIESRNVFAPCTHFGHRRQMVMLSCETCGRTFEVEDDALADALDRAAASAGFVPRRRMVEVEGVCATCAGR